MTSLSLCFLLGLHHQVPSLFTKEIHHPERKKIFKMLLLKETLARISPVTYLWCVTTCWDMGWHGDTDNVVWIVSPHVLTPKYFSLFLLNIQIFNPNLQYHTSYFNQTVAKHCIALLLHLRGQTNVSFEEERCNFSTFHLFLSIAAKFMHFSTSIFLVQTLAPSLLLVSILHF